MHLNEDAPAKKKGFIKKRESKKRDGEGQWKRRAVQTQLNKRGHGTGKYFADSIQVIEISILGIIRHRLRMGLLLTRSRSLMSD